MSKYSSHLAALIFLACALACKLRVVDLPTNFALFGALSIFCGAYLRGFAAWGIPLFGIVVGDFLGDRLGVSGVHRYGFQSMLFTYTGFAAMIGVGHLLRLRDSIESVLGTAIAGSVAFYLISNFGSWLNPLMNYDRSPSGLLACYWAGIPFFKYTFLSDVLFTLAFVGANRLALANAPQSANAPVDR
ncbi:MAG: DUF6580 family putative transport protein [Pirellulaceae bacterium]|nr:DUF6580 family putative transport protein [Pirellulaceae bacterium]